MKDSLLPLGCWPEPEGSRWWIFNFGYFGFTGEYFDFGLDIKNWSFSIENLWFELGPFYIGFRPGAFTHLPPIEVMRKKFDALDSIFDADGWNQRT